MLIQKEMKLADVIHHDHNLVPVINRFGIRLGFGEKTIEELADEYEINADFFLVILNAYHDPQYFPEETFTELSSEYPNRIPQKIAQLLHRTKNSGN